MLYLCAKNQSLLISCISLGNVLHDVSMLHRPLTLKVDEDDEVVILEVIAPPKVKVFDKVPPSP